MIRKLFGASVLAGLGATVATANPIAFYTDGSINLSMPSYSVAQSDGAAGPATIDVEQRIPNPQSQFLPQFDSTLGTLNRVDLYFGIGSASSADNSVSVNLDPCQGCEKDLKVELSFGFGADITGLSQEQSGPIRQFFEISEQSLLEFGDFDNDASTPFRPNTGSVSLTPGSIDGEYSVRSFTDDLDFFTGSGDVVFDVGAAVNLFASLSCRDASLNQVSCSEDLDLSIGDASWALQIVYDYTPAFDPGLGTGPPDPGITYSDFDEFEILPPGSGPNDLRFFDGTTPFEPEVVPLPLPALLLLTGIAALIGLGGRAAIGV